MRLIRSLDASFKNPLLFARSRYGFTYGYVSLRVKTNHNSRVTSTSTKQQSRANHRTLAHRTKVCGKDATDIVGRALDSQRERSGNAHRVW